MKYPWMVKIPYLFLDFVIDWHTPEICFSREVPKLIGKHVNQY